VVPATFESDFKKFLVPYFNDSISAATKVKRDARLAKKGKLISISSFCDWHRSEYQSKVLKKDTWPASIGRQTLPARMQKLLPILNAIARQPVGTLAYGKAKDCWHRNGRPYATQSLGMWEAVGM
jgi:hypothetical protein